MKPLYLSLLFAAILSGGLMYFSHAKFSVKYSQIFAEKRITLAENMTLAQKINLQNKKGFLAYE